MSQEEKVSGRKGVKEEKVSRKKRCQIKKRCQEPNRLSPDLLNVGDPTLLFLNGPNIVDTKSWGPTGTANQPSLQRYFNAEPGVTVRSMKQQLIIYLKDAAGQSIKFTLPKIFSVTYTKVNNSTVKIALQ